MADLDRNEPPKSAALEDLLKRYFGYSSFRSSQAEIIKHVQSGRHAMVVMPTGMGKSLCYQIPALARNPSEGDLTLVLSPLVALMHDQVESLVSRGIDAALINSSLARETRIFAIRSCRIGKVHIAVRHAGEVSQTGIRRCTAIATRAFVSG